MTNDEATIQSAFAKFIPALHVNGVPSVTHETGAASPSRHSHPLRRHSREGA
jgi:hypothetical protein